MATDVQPTETRSKLYRISVNQYLKMIGAGVFPETARIELLGGKLVEKMTKYPAHHYAVGCLGRLLGAILPEPWFVSEEKPVKIGRFWYPEPDIAVVRGPHQLYKTKTPEAKDVGFVFEASESSDRQDREKKWRLYASARIPFYWIANIPLRRVEVYSEPSGKGSSAFYRQSTILIEGQEIPFLLDGQELGRIAVGDFMP